MPTQKPATGWRNRIVGHGMEAPERLAANPRNWRVHPQAQTNALEAALEEVGWAGHTDALRGGGQMTLPDIAALSLAGRADA